MHYLRASGLQVFLTTADERLVAEAAGEDARLYRIRAGAITA
jgi:hypothetical protein